MILGLMIGNLNRRFEQTSQPIIATIIGGLVLPKPRTTVQPPHSNALLSCVITLLVSPQLLHPVRSIGT